MRLFEVKVKNGKLLYLTLERWEHIIREHPILVKSYEDLINTLLHAFIIKQSIHDQFVYFYYKYFRNVSASGMYLVVVVKYLNGEGFVITSFYTDNIKGV